MIETLDILVAGFHSRKAIDEIFDNFTCNLHYIDAASEGAQILAESEIALIIIDLDDPLLKGCEIAKGLSLTDQCGHVPFLFLGAEGVLYENKQLFHLNDGADFLITPFNAELFEKKVVSLIELFRRGKQLEKKAYALAVAREEIARQQQRIVEGEFRFRIAFEQSFQFMAILDPVGRVVELNRLAKKLCGNFTGEYTGRYLWNLCWVGQDEENEKLEKAVLEAASGVYVSDEAPFTDHNGKVYHFVRAISPVHDSDGVVKFVSVQGHDISERVQAEVDNRNLERLLQQSYKMEALGTLSGGIAHDFNNILSVIMGNAELADRYCKDGQILQCIADIKTAGRKARELVKQILTFSCKSEPEVEIIRPAEIVLESLKLLRATIPATITITHDIDESCGMIWGNPIQYHQMVVNLCTNALYSMEGDTGRLSLSLYVKHGDDTHHLQEQGRAYVVLRVQDTGCGIHSKNIKRIFEPYFTTREKESGTGMGLAIVHGIVKKHNGFIEVNSNIGEGTTFMVYIPMVPCDSKDKEKVLL